VLRAGILDVEPRKRQLGVGGKEMRRTVNSILFVSSLIFALSASAADTPPPPKSLALSDQEERSLCDDGSLVSARVGDVALEITASTKAPGGPPVIVVAGTNRKALCNAPTKEIHYSCKRGEKTNDFVATYSCPSGIPPDTGTPDIDALYREALGTLGKLPGCKGMPAIVIYGSYGIYRMPAWIDEGDEFCAAVMGDDGTLWKTVTLDTCGILPAGPTILVSGAFPKNGAQSLKEGEKAASIATAGPFQCSGSDVTLAANGVKDDKVTTAKVTFHLYPRYNFTLQFTTVWSDLRDKSFAISKATSPTILDHTDQGKGPDYFAGVVLYAWPNYFLKGRRYLGRDPVHDNRLLDRLGLLLGVSIDNPKKRALVGLTFELAKGLNVVAGHEFASVNELADGYKIGDAFSGTADQIPVRARWRGKTVFGVSLDLRIARALFEKQ
jgi:hypothetical protein